MSINTLDPLPKDCRSLDCLNQEQREAVLELSRKFALYLNKEFQYFKDGDEVYDGEYNTNRKASSIINVRFFRAIKTGYWYLVKSKYHNDYKWMLFHNPKITLDYLPQKTS